MRTAPVLLLLAGCGAAPVADAPAGDTDASAHADPIDAPVGRVALRRLTREEYQRTVRDLTGVQRALAAELPADDASHGFDNAAQSLVVSPLHIESYERLAAEIVREILDRPLQDPVDLTLEAETAATTDAQHDVRDGALGLFTSGTVSADLELPEDGRYRVSARVWGDQAGEDPVLVDLGLAFEEGDTFEVPGDGPDEAAWIMVEVDVRRGRHLLELVFLNDYYADGQDRNLYVDALRIEGPLDHVPRENPAWDQVMTCDPDAEADDRACAARILAEITPRAWRRPVASSELEVLLGLYDEVLAGGDSPRTALGYALRGVLASPHFLFLVEPAPQGSGREPVDDHALATRLSYLLWSSMPDDALLAVAAEGRLNDPEVLEAQVHRMLADPKAGALSEVYAGQWLMIRALDDARPDESAYLGFSEDLRSSMRTSMLLTFDALIREDRPMTELLTSREAFLDHRLARTYDRQVGADEGFRRVDVGTSDRRGWLTTAGLLTATSYPTRTSPVRRGVWVLSNLLCDEPPPPPADVEGFPDASGEATTIRERLELHRQNPSCRGCHQLIDPIGLAFEHFNGVGVRRFVDAGEPVNASGQLPDGTLVDGIPDLAEALAADPRFPRCVVEKLWTYAHSRAPGESDAPHLEHAVERYLEGGGTFAAAVVAVVTSDTFRFQEVSP